MRNEERQIHSDIDKVRKALETTLAEVGKLVENHPARSTNLIQDPKKNISSAAINSTKAPKKNISSAAINSTMATTSNSSKAKVEAVLQAQGTILEDLLKHLKG